MKGKKELLELFNELNISYKSYHHEPINSVKDAEIYAKEIGGAHCKNLFLKDAQEKLYLVIALENKKIDLKKLANELNSKRLSFASHELLENYLGIKPGCVTPFALINDIKKTVVVIFDKEVLSEEEASFHPLINTETITIRLKDLIKFIDFCGQKRVCVENNID